MLKDQAVAASALPRLLQILALVTYLPPRHTLVSVYASGSGDGTPELLNLLQGLLDVLKVPNHIVAQVALAGVHAWQGIAAACWAAAGISTCIPFIIITITLSFAHLIAAPTPPHHTTPHPHHHTTACDCFKSVFSQGGAGKGGVWHSTPL